MLSIKNRLGCGVGSVEFFVFNFAGVCGFTTARTVFKWVTIRCARIAGSRTCSYQTQGGESAGGTFGADKSAVSR